MRTELEVVFSTSPQSLRSQGLSSAQIAQAIDDFCIILDAMLDSPTAQFAMPALADKVLHWILDSPELTAQIEALFGPGAKARHDPEAWGTEKYAEGWKRTVAAFAARGIYLSSDPAATRTDGREGFVCAFDMITRIN